jgi:protein TonB
MRRRNDLCVATVPALLLHVGLVAAAAWYRRRAPLEPEFVFGESAVRMTLVAVPPAVAEPEPPRPEPMEPLPELPEQPALLPPPQPEPEEPVEDPRPAPVVEPLPAPAPAPEALDADIRAKGVETSAIDSGSVRPRYPLGSRLRGEEGLVRLTVRVDASGRAIDVSVSESSGYTALDRAAVKAAWQARYTARTGQTRAGETTFAIRFRLED